MTRDPAGSQQRLAEIQEQFERAEGDMRAFIRGLRPVPVEHSLRQTEALDDRCLTLRRRVEAQWPVVVDMQLSIADRQLPVDLTNQIFFIVQEAVVNAAKHARASIIRVSVRAMDEMLRVEISDDGKGFPFAGSYDLAMLNAMGRGPLTLKERVTELNGLLRLDSSQAGARMVITLPLAVA